VLTLGRLYQSCGILGATVMPHSLYLGSGIVQSRLHDFDEKHHLLDSTPPRSSSASTSSNSSSIYRPSLRAIRSCLAYSCAELALSLFTFALFVNSAILIVAGASLSSLPADQVASADLFSIHDLLARTVAPVAGTIFALALLLSGTSAGIVCTIAGQMVSEGQLDWSVRPWVRRLATRSISILPSIVVAGAVGREGLARALEGSQVALSIILPVVSAPLIWFTCSARVMAVDVDRQMAPREEAAAAAPAIEGGVPASAPAPAEGAGEAPREKSVRLREPEQAAEGALLERVVMRNGWLVAGMAIVVWLVLTVMNVALLVLLGLGQG
jgi:metal iron transporter